MLTREEITKSAHAAADGMTAIIDSAGLSPTGKKVADRMVNGLSEVMKNSAMLVAALAGPDEAMRVVETFKKAARFCFDEHDRIDALICAEIDRAKPERETQAPAASEPSPASAMASEIAKIFASLGVDVVVKVTEVGGSGAIGRAGTLERLGQERA
jgi:hypothetical protein